jgi:hypothetical protein
MSSMSNKASTRLAQFWFTAGPTAWLLVWIGAIALAAFVHLAFFVVYPDNFLHEDSGPYLSEAQAILTGHYVDDPGRRPYGVAYFFVMLSKLFSPNILVFVTAQHVVSVLTAIMISASVRFAGAPRILALATFFLAALYARTIHYDNTIGAETISVSLTALAVFVGSGLIFKNWPPIFSAIGIGLSLGAAMLCRSAAVGVAVVVLVWLLAFARLTFTRRMSLAVLAGLVAAVVYVTPSAINWFLGKHAAENEDLAVMAFVVGYSADFDHGVHLDRKAQARQFVNKMRAAAGPLGWADVDEYQWPFGAMNLMRRPNESDANIEKVVRDIFIETLLTPSTLWHHLTHHFFREMYFLMFDANAPARRTSNPQAYEYFVKRDPFPIFHSPTGIQSRRFIYDHYSPPRLLARFLPSADRIQLWLNRAFSLGYSPRPDPAPLCCGLEISSEYDDLPGPIRWYSLSTLILLVFLIIAAICKWRSGIAAPLNLEAAGWLMVVMALVNAAFPAFLIYGFNRYGYYLVPFMAGAAGILGSMLFEWIRLGLISWRGRQTRMTIVEQAG